MKESFLDHSAAGLSSVQANLLPDPAYTRSVQMSIGSEAHSKISRCNVSVFDNEPNPAVCTVQTPASWDGAHRCARAPRCFVAVKRGALSRLRRPCSRHALGEQMPVYGTDGSLRRRRWQTSEPRRKKFDLRAAGDSSCRRDGMGLYGTNPRQGELKGWLPLRSPASSTLATTTVGKAASSPHHSGPITASVGDHRGQ